MFNTDAADAFYLRRSNTSCLDVSPERRSSTSSRQGFLRRRSASLGGPGDSYAYVSNDAGHHTLHSSKILAWPPQPQSGSWRAYTRLEGAIEPGTPYSPINPYPRPSTTTANPSSATAAGGGLHLPAAYRRVGASLSIAGSGAWERADYLPRSCRASSAAGPPASVVHSSDASRATVVTSTRFAGGSGGGGADAHLLPQRVHVVNRNGVNGARAYGSMGTSILSVARGVRAASGTGPTERPSSAPSAMSEATSGRRDSASSAAYTTNICGSRGDGFGRLLAPSASKYPLASDSRSQRATEHELRTSAPVNVSIHKLARYSSEDPAIAGRSAAAINGSGATSWTAGQRARPYLPPSSSAMHKRIATTALEQDDGDCTTVSAMPAHSTRWSAGPPSPPASVRSVPTGASSLLGKGESALIARSPKKPQSYAISPTVTEQDPRSSEVDAAEHDIDEGASTWWTVDIVMNSAPCHGDSAYEETAAMKAVALLRSPADMRTLRSVQCRAPVLPADASADEAWDMTQSLLRCIALASVGASSPPCAPQGYFCFNTDFNEYMQLSADTLPLASTLFSVVMVVSSVDTAIAEEDRAGYTEISDAATDEAQTALVSTPYSATHNHYLVTGASPSCNQDGAAPQHHWSDAAERGAAAVTPRPPSGSRRTSVPRHALRPSLQPHTWEHVAPSPPPPQPSAATGSASRHRLAFDGNTSSHHYLTTVEEVSPYPQRPLRSYASAVMSPGARGNCDSAGVISTYDGDAGEDDSYRVISYSVESDAGDAVYGAASPPAPPTSCKGRAHDHYVDGNYAAGEEMDDAADSGYGNGVVGYMDDDEAVPQAEAGEVIGANVVCTAKAAERQLSASDDSSSGSVSSNHEGASRLQCFHNVPISSKPSTQPLSSPSTTHGLPARPGSDSMASSQRPPTAPTQGYSRVGVFAAMQRPSPSTLPTAPLQPPPQQLFFDDPVLQRHFESACKQSPPSPQHATASADSGGGDRHPIYVPSPPRTVPVPPSPPLPPTPPVHGAYRPGAHPYFDPSPSTASCVPGFAPTPPFSAYGTEALTATMNRAQRDALNVLLQRSSQARQQASGSQVPFRSPSTPVSSGDVAVSAASPRVTTSMRPQTPRAAVNSAVDSAATATGGIASAAHRLVAPSLSSLSPPPLPVTDAAVPQAVAAPPPTSAEKSTDTPTRHDRSPFPQKAERPATMTAGEGVLREVEANDSLNTRAAVAAIVALPESCAGAVEATSQGDQRNREQAQRNHSTRTAPTLEGGEKDKEAAGMYVDVDHDAEGTTVVTTAAAAVEESRKSRGGGVNAFGYFADADTKPLPAAGRSAPPPAGDESDAVAAGVGVPKESARTSPTDTDRELPASAVGAEEFDKPSASESAAAKEKNKDDCSHSQSDAATPDAYSVEAGDPDTIPTVTAVAARQAVYKVAGNAPEQATPSQEAPDTAAATRLAEYPTETPRAHGDSDIAGGAEVPGESTHNSESAAEVMNIAAPASTSGIAAHIAAAEAVGKTPASDSTAEPVDTEQPDRQPEKADCTPEDDTPGTNVCGAQLEARTCANDAPLLLSEKQPSSVTDDIAMKTEGTREEGEEAGLACPAEPALEASLEMHGDEHHAGVGEGSKAASPLQPDHSAESSTITDNEGNKAPSAAGTSVRQRITRTSDASDSPQTLGSDDGDELASAVVVDMLSSKSAVAEKDPFSAATEANTLEAQSDVAAAAAPAIAGGDSTPFLMIAAAKFLPAPVISVATQREKDEDPDAPPQVLHHRAAAAAAAAAANAFYGLWEESMTEDGTGDGDDAGGADHVDATAVGGDDGEGDQHDCSSTSEAVTAATISTSEGDIEGAVDVPMDVFRDSLSLTNTPTLIRRGEWRDENTSVAAMASLADPIDMLARTIGSNMCLPPASRAVTLVVNPDAGVGSTDVLFHLHHKEFLSAVVITASVGAAAAVGESGITAETSDPNTVKEASASSAEVVQRLQAPSPAAHVVSPAFAASSPPSAASQPVASPDGSTAQTAVDANAAGDRFSSALQEAEASPDAINGEPHVEPHRSTEPQVDGPVPPLFEVSGDVDCDGAADAPQRLPSLLWPFVSRLQRTTPAVPLPLSPSEVLSLPTPSLPPSTPLSEGAMKKTMVLLGFPGSAWEFIMTHHYESMHDAFTTDSAVAANVPISAIQDVRYSKGSLMVDLYVLHPASSSENFIRDQMSSYTYPTLWGFYEVKKRERKQLLHDHGMSVAGAMSAQSLLPRLTPTLSSQEEVSWTAS